MRDAISAANIDVAEYQAQSAQRIERCIGARECPHPSRTCYLALEVDEPNQERRDGGAERNHNQKWFTAEVRRPHVSSSARYHVPAYLSHGRGQTCHPKRRDIKLLSGCESA